MTRRMMLIAGIASIALAAPAQADRDRSGRGDGDRKAERSQKAERKANRPQRAERPRAQRSERRESAERSQRQRTERRAERRSERAERRNARRQAERRVERTERRQAERRSERAERRNPRRQAERRVERAERREARQRVERRDARRQAERRIERAERRDARRQLERRAERAERSRSQRLERRIEGRAERREARRDNRRDDFRRELRRDRREARRDLREAGQERRDNRRFLRALAENREMRPMRRLAFDDSRFISIGERIEPRRFRSFVPTIYRTRYVNTPDYYYRYDDDRGYLYRVDRDDDVVRALIPLFGGYGIGDPWPMTYRSSYVPYGYRNLYYDTPNYYYRNDGYGIYRIDAGTQLITALVALLAGQSFGVGQMLPASYGAYNVPLGYRASYYDHDDGWYRYGNGFIYEVDPYSRRIDARYPLYGDNYWVGQPWPVAYPDYNVPYAYRSLYYDTPEWNYRYANGAIYQVDPTTQMITALVALLTGQQFGIGQPMPAGYSTYNVPFAYRDDYYDTDNEWYRYANGYVYQIDADDGLIEEAYPIYV